MPLLGLLFFFLLSDKSLPVTTVVARHDAAVTVEVAVLLHLCVK